MTLSAAPWHGVNLSRGSAFDALPINNRGFASLAAFEKNMHGHDKLMPGHVDVHPALMHPVFGYFIDESRQSTHAQTPTASEQLRGVCERVSPVNPVTTINDEPRVATTVFTS